MDANYLKKKKKRQVMKLEIHVPFFFDFMMHNLMFTSTYTTEKTKANNLKIMILICCINCKVFICSVKSSFTPNKQIFPSIMLTINATFMVLKELT